MLKTLEATGRSEEAAVQKALKELGLERDSVSVEVLQRAKTGFLGIGSAPAKVRVTYEVPDEPKAAVPADSIKPKSPVQAEPVTAEPAAAETVKTEPVKAEPAQADQAKAPKPKAEKKTAPKKPETPKAPAPAKKDTSEAADDDSVEARIQAFLPGLLEHMGFPGVTLVIDSSRAADIGIMVTLKGERLGGIIGHRGTTLDAIQQLTNYAVNRSRSHRVRIRVDAENYRVKREETLRHLAKKVAAKVTKTHHNVTLEPMNAYERHVIHETLQDYGNIITYSTGEEPNRRTVVAFSRGKHTY